MKLPLLVTIKAVSGRQSVSVPALAPQAPGPRTPAAAMGETYIRHMELLGFEKRFFPSQHYVSTWKG